MTNTNASARADDDIFLTTRHVRSRYGNASAMWVHRRLHDNSGFPKPIMIAGRRLWRLADLVAWERAQAANKAGA